MLLLDVTFPNSRKGLWKIHSLELTWKWRMAPKGRPFSTANRWWFSTSMLVPGRVKCITLWCAMVKSKGASHGDRTAHRSV